MIPPSSVPEQKRAYLNGLSESEIYDLLRCSYYLEVDGGKEPFGGGSPFFQRSTTALLFSDRTDCENKCAEFSEMFSRNLRVSNVENIWELVQRCARIGHEGLVLDFLIPVYFSNRLSDLDRSVPTVAEVRRLQGEKITAEIFSFGAFGAQKVRSAILTRWKDLKKFDAQINEWILNGKISTKNLDPHIIRSDFGTEFLTASSTTILGSQISHEPGAFMIFGDEHLARRHYERLSSDDLQLVPKIKSVDLLTTLQEFRNLGGPLVDIVLNPNCPRQVQGWFFEHDDKWILETVSGFWDLDSSIPTRTNVIPPKQSTVIRSDTHTHLRTSQVGSAFQDLHIQTHLGITNEDAQNLLDQISSAEISLVEIYPPKIPHENHYLAEVFDKFSGENLALSSNAPTNDFGYHVFRNFVDACLFIAQRYLPFNEELRIEGFHYKGFWNQQPSGDPKAEKLKTAAIKSALEKLCISAIVDGYTPWHSERLLALVNDLFFNLEIRSCGYMADITLFGDGSQHLAERARQEIDLFPFNDGLVQGNVARIESLRRELLNRTKLTEAQTALSELDLRISDLSEGSLLILDSALKDYRTIGANPQYDYSGITMKLAKVFEREIAERIILPFKKLVRGELQKSDLRLLEKSNQIGKADNLLLRLVQNKEKVTLGNINFLFRSIDTMAPNKFSDCFKQYLNGFDQPKWLIEGEFSKNLSMISERYRNGGVHRSIINHDTCQEALKILIHDPNAVLKQFINASRINAD